MYIQTYVYIYIYIYVYIYIYIYMAKLSADPGIAIDTGTVHRTAKPISGKLHPVSVRRFPSFRTQPLENFSRYL